MAASPPKVPAGFAARLVEFAAELRAEGVSSGTAELLDAVAVLEQVPWTEPEDFREALAATLAKSPDDRRVFALVFERFFFRAAELAAIAEGVREGGGGRGRRGRRARRDRSRHAAPPDRRRDARRLGERDARPRAAGDRRVRPRGVGVGRHRRRRAAHPARARAALRPPARPSGRRPAPRRRSARRAAALRGAAAPRARARADRAHVDAAAVAAAERASIAPCRRARSRTSPPCTASSRSSSGG